MCIYNNYDVLNSGNFKIIHMDSAETTVTRHALMLLTIPVDTLYKIFMSVHVMSAHHIIASVVKL